MVVVTFFGIELFLLVEIREHPAVSWSYGGGQVSLASVSSLA